MSAPCSPAQPQPPEAPRALPCPGRCRANAHRTPRSAAAPQPLGPPLFLSEFQRSARQFLARDIFRPIDVTAARALPGAAGRSPRREDKRALPPHGDRSSRPAGLRGWGQLSTGGCGAARRCCTVGRVAGQHGGAAEPGEVAAAGRGAGPGRYGQGGRGCELLGLCPAGFSSAPITRVAQPASGGGVPSRAGPSL